MKKTVAIISDSPELKTLCDAMEEVKHEHDERMKFISKSAEDASKAASEKFKPLMEELRAKLKEKGKLTDENHHVIYSIEGDNVAITDDEHMRNMMVHNMKQHLAEILGLNLV
jgi:hypothetical protein